VSLTEELTTDLKDAMKARDKLKVSTIRMLMADLKNDSIAKKGELTEAEELTVLARQAKRRQESIEAFRGAGRDELADKEAAELRIIELYLPKQLGADEVEEMAREVIAAVGATSKKDMGQVMGQLMPRLKGRFPGKEVRPIVERLLGA